MTSGFRLLPLLLPLLAAPALAQDYGAYHVLDTTEVEMMAGPGMTAALLSPDGSRVLHFHSDACLYAPAEVGSWARLGCVDLTEENRPGLAMDMLWSPDGMAMLKPNYERSMQRFEDTDIEVIDPVTLAARNLTDDGYEGAVLKGGPSDFDISPHWLDAATIAFIRYEKGADGRNTTTPPALMRIAADGSGEPAIITSFPVTTGIGAGAIAASLDGKQIAYLYAGSQEPAAGGIWTVPADGSAAPVRVIGLDALGNLPMSLTYSADGNKLLLLGMDASGFIGARVLDVATGAITPIAAGQNITGAAWSPTGAALAYTTYDREQADMPGGLFLTESADKPARLLLGGAFMAPACCSQFPFTWATNDSILLTGVGEKMGTVTLVRLGPQGNTPDSAPSKRLNR